jgi:hypothetical protein
MELWASLGHQRPSWVFVPLETVVGQPAVSPNPLQRSQYVLPRIGSAAGNVSQAPLVAPEPMELSALGWVNLVRCLERAVLG